MNEIVAIIKQHVKKLEIQFVENKIMNQLSYNVLNDKIISKGFKFSGNLKNGISETIKTLKNVNYINKLS